MPQLLEMLHSQHETVKGLLEQMEQTEKKSEKERLFAQLKHDLEPHMKGEEKYFYPALKEKEENKEDVLEAIEEHHAARLFLRELDGMSPDGERWDAKLAVLKEIIEHHVEEEETNIFPKAEESLSEEQMMEIGDSFENGEKRKQGRPSRNSQE